MFKIFAMAIAFLACVAACETRAKAATSGAVGRHIGEINIAASATGRGGRLSSPTENESVPHEEPSNTSPKNGAAPNTVLPKKVENAVTVVGIGLDVVAISGMVLLAVASALGFFYSGRNRDLGDDEPPTRSVQNQSGSLAGSPETESDIVEVSAFAPAIAKAEEEVFIQIFFHKLDQTAVVEAQAESTDPSTSLRGKATLDAEIPRGERLDVILEGPPDLKIEEPHQYLIWRGEPRSCQFIVALPSLHDGRRTIYMRVRILLAGVPLGTIRFPLAVSSYEESTPLELAGQTAQRNRRAFLSYASTDRAEVLKRMQALKVARIECFQDFIDLEPGERWERRLYEEIDRCDLFVLFWSTAAANSQWVAREAEYAIQRQKMQGERAIEITPIILEGPPIPVAPEILKDIHFNDAIRYVISAVETETNATRINQNARIKKKYKKSRGTAKAAPMPKWIAAAKETVREWI